MNPTFDPSQIPLRDIHLPEAIAWWPPAVGWWLLAVGLVVVGVALSVRYSRRRRHRAANRALRRAMAALRAGGDPAGCAREVSTILRRFAMTMSDEPAQVAGLTGEAWLRYLDGHWEREAFRGEAGRRLLSSPYDLSTRVKLEHAAELGLLSLAWVQAQPAKR